MNSQGIAGIIAILLIVLLVVPLAAAGEDRSIRIDPPQAGADLHVEVTGIPASARLYLQVCVFTPEYFCHNEVEVPRSGDLNSLDFPIELEEGGLGGAKIVIVAENGTQEKIPQGFEDGEGVRFVTFDPDPFRVVIAEEGEADTTAEFGTWYFLVGPASPASDDGDERTLGYPRVGLIAVAIIITAVWIVGRKYR